MGKYRGEHPCKRVARTILWGRSAFELQIVGSPVLVLASSYGGDIGFFSAHGKEQHLIAVDTDPIAVDMCAKRWPGVDIRHCRAEDVRQDLGGCFLDFCSNMNTATLSTFHDVGKKVIPGGLIAVAFLKGRDRVADVSLGNRKTRRANTRETVPIKGVKGNNRIGVMISALQTTLLTWCPLFVIEYRSTSPMIIIAGQRRQSNIISKEWGVDHAIMKVRKISDADIMRMCAKAHNPKRALLEHGFSPKEAAARLAHIARGTYGRG